METMSVEKVNTVLKSYGITLKSDDARFIIEFVDKINSLSQRMDEYILLQKPVLNFDETCRYLDISASHLYKLTSQKQIPHFCPQGKKLYFRRDEIDQWLQRNRQSSAGEIDEAAADYIMRNKRGR